MRLELTIFATGKQRVAITPQSQALTKADIVNMYLIFDMVVRRLTSQYSEAREILAVSEINIECVVCKGKLEIVCQKDCTVGVDPRS